MLLEIVLCIRLKLLRFDLCARLVVVGLRSGILVIPRCSEVLDDWVNPIAGVYFEAAADVDLGIAGAYY